MLCTRVLCLANACIASPSYFTASLCRSRTQRTIPCRCHAILFRRPALLVLSKPWRIISLPLLFSETHIKASAKHAKPQRIIAFLCRLKAPTISAFTEQTAPFLAHASKCHSFPWHSPASLCRSIAYLSFALAPLCFVASCLSMLKLWSAGPFRCTSMCLFAMPVLNARSNTIALISKPCRCFRCFSILSYA